MMGDQYVTRRDAMRHECPKCGVSPDVECVTPIGEPHVRRGGQAACHQERMIAARAAQPMRRPLPRTPWENM